MTYEERINLIGTLLRDTILPRYKRPEHLDDATARAELRDMVEDLNAAWPLMHPARFESVGDDLARQLRSTYTGRSWPPIAVMIKALKAALSGGGGDGKLRGSSELDLMEARGAQLLNWCRGEGNCGEGLITRDNLLVLADAGHISAHEIPRMLAYAAAHMGVWKREAPAQREERGFVRIKAPAPEGAA